MSISPNARTSVAAILACVALSATVLPASAQGAGGEAPRPQELVVAFGEMDVQPDPHHSIYMGEAQIFTAIYEGLFTYNPSSLEPVKAACRSYSKSQDGRLYTFYLRDDARWSDGSPLLARDFRDAWLRALAPAQKADYAAFFDVIAGAREYRLGAARDPASVAVSVVGDKVLQVKLATRADYFTRLLCHHSFSPIHPSMVARRDWRAAAPFPVNGPWAIQSWSRGEIVLARNESYWDAASVAVPRIRALLTDDDKGATRRFDSGEIHWLADSMDLDILVDRGSLQVNPMFGTHYWFFGCEAAPWKDPDVRRALALLLPWKDIRSRDQYLIPAETLVLSFAGYDAVKGISATDEAEARRLLAAAGYPDGKGLPRLTVMAPEEGEDALRVATLMKSAWERLPGLEVVIRQEPHARYFDLVRAGPGKSGYTLALTTWIGDFADPLAFLQMWSSDSNLNDAALADAEYDRLLAEAAGKEGGERLSSLAAAETRLLSGAAVLPIYHSIAVNVVDTDFVTGWYPNALDIHPFKYIAFGERKARPNVAGLGLSAGGAVAAARKGGTEKE